MKEKERLAWQNLALNFMLESRKKHPELYEKPKRMSKEEAIERLDKISKSDPESAHSEADAIILEMVDPEIAAAYERLVERCSFWACA